MLKLMNLRKNHSTGNSTHGSEDKIIDCILVRFLYQPACRQARIHYDSINNQEWVFYLGFLDKIIDCVGGLFLS